MLALTPDEQLEEFEGARAELEEGLGELRGQLGREPDEKEIRGFFNSVPDLRDTQTRMRTAKREIRRRTAIDNKVAAIEKADERIGKAVTRLTEKGQELLNRIDRASDTRIAAFEKQVAEVEALNTRTEADLGATLGRDADFTQLTRLVDDVLEEVQTPAEKKHYTALKRDIQKAAKLEGQTSRKLERAQGTLGRTKAALAKLKLAQSLAIQRATLLKARTDERIDALLKVPDEKRAKLTARMEKRIGKYQAQLDQFGAEEVEGGGFKLGPAVRDISRAVAKKITGEQGRVPLTGIVFERGPEIGRRLNIDPDEQWGNGRYLREFMIEDIDDLSRLYARSVAPDIEISRSFGDVTPFSRDFDEATGAKEAKAGVARGIVEDFDKARAEAAEKFEGDRLKKELGRISDAERATFRDFTGVIERIRNLRHIGMDPSSIPQRMGKSLLNLNTMLYMGGVTISSVADLGRTIFRLGLMSTFRDGFGSLRDIQTFNALRSEARLAGAGLDLVGHSRFHEMADVFEMAGQGTRAERILQYGTNNMGRIALFDYWNASLKQFVGVMATTKLMHDIDKVMHGATGRPLRFLQGLGLGDDALRRIWFELENGGATEANGVRLPNTEDWRSADARRAFRAAVVRAVDDTIVTPGPERPLIMDGSLFGRLVFQFQSFGFSSLPKTLMYGKQQLMYGDLNIPLGIALSVALGGLSWYLKALLVGGKAQKDMEKADTGKWVDEGIARSGLLGPLGNAITVGQKMPLLADYMSFSGDVREQTHHLTNPFVAQLGPSISTGTSAARLAQSLHDPSAATARAIRQLTPYNNVFMWARQLRDLEREIGKELD